MTDEVLNFPALLADLRRDEGCVLTAYQDSRGVWTIGYGRNLQVLEIDRETAERWLAEDARRALRHAERVPGWDELDEVRRRQLVGMLFNMGPRGLGQFRRFQAALRAGDWFNAAVELLDSRWYGQVGPRAERVAAAVLTGQDLDRPGEVLAPVFDEVRRRRQLRVQV